MRVFKGGFGNIPNKFTGIVESQGGNKYWFLKGKHHRVGGPAVEWWDGTSSWGLNGEWITEEEHSRRTAWTKTTLGRLILKEDYFKLTGEIK
jgi:hypothetical protein